MEYSENYGFRLPSSDVDDIADVNDLSVNFEILDEHYPDQTYDPTSENAQSGTAVAQAVADKLTLVTATWLNEEKNNDHVGEWYQCTTTGNGYTAGYIYRGVSISSVGITTYRWARVNVQPEVELSDFTAVEIDDYWDEVEGT